MIGSSDGLFFTYARRSSNDASRYTAMLDSRMQKKKGKKHGVEPEAATVRRLSAPD